jgi:hypothetical protein
MSRKQFASFCTALAIAAAPAALVAQQPATSAAAAAATPAAVTPADAAPFMGDWTLTLESPMGPAAMALSVKNDAGKVVASLSSDMQPLTNITDITKTGPSLLLSYSFDYEGNAVPVVVTLTPKADKLDAHLSFAAGAFEMSGTGAKTAK